MQFYWFLLLENQEAAVQEGATPDPEEGTSKTAQGMLLI